MLISPSQSATATAPVPIAVKRLPAACIVVRYSNSKRAGRDSIAAQETFQIVQFLAGTGGLAQPAAEFLQYAPCPLRAGKTRGRIEPSQAFRRAPEGIGALGVAKLTWPALTVLTISELLAGA